MPSVAQPPPTFNTLILDFYGREAYSPNLNLKQVSVDPKTKQGATMLEYETWDPQTKRYVTRANAAERSDYQPDQKVRERTAGVMRDFWYARQTMNLPYLEFNNESVLSRLTEDQHSFNMWVEPPSGDPDEEWRSDAYDPVVRNKVFSIAAHMTRALVLPTWEARDKDNNDDKDAAEVMNHLVEYATDQGEYESNLFFAVIDALVTPAAIVHHEYAEVYRDVKEQKVDDTGKVTYEVKQVLDDEFSGFQDTLLGVDELFIADAYIPGRHLQRQPYLIWRRVIPYDTAWAKYHGNANFDAYVREGVQLLFDQQTLVFYRQYDENLRGRMVEEVIYWHRQRDLRLTFVNGVLLDDPDKPNPRKDKRYPFVTGGYSTFNHRFFWFSSLVKSLSKNEKAINSLYRMIIDGTYLQLMKPIAVTGSETIDSSVVIPGNIVNLRSDTKVNPLDFGNNLAAGVNAYKIIRDVMEESSTADLSDDGKGAATAYQISQEEAQTYIMMGLFAKMISFMVRDWGLLYAGDVLQHMTVGEAQKLESGDLSLKFAQFLLPAKNGKKRRKINFDPNLSERVAKLPVGEKGSYKGKPLDFDRLSEEGGPDGDMSIYTVDPQVFSKLIYSCKVTAQELLPPSDAVQRAMDLEEFDRMIQSPVADQQEALKLLLEAYPRTNKNPDRYIMKQQPGQPGAGDVVPQAAKNGIVPQNLKGGFPDKAPMSASGALQKFMGQRQTQRQPMNTI